MSHSCVRTHPIKKTWGSWPSASVFVMTCSCQVLGNTVIYPPGLGQDSSLSLSVGPESTVVGVQGDRKAWEQERAVCSQGAFIPQCLQECPQVI